MIYFSYAERMRGQHLKQYLILTQIRVSSLVTSEIIFFNCNYAITIRPSREIHPDYLNFCIQKLRGPFDSHNGIRQLLLN